MVETIDWPRLVIGDRTYLLRVTFSTWYQLGKWGIADSWNDLEFAAACAGNFDNKGKWHSAGFARPQDLVDLITDLAGDAAASQAVEDIKVAVADALKKARPRQENSPAPAGQTVASIPMDGSAPGPSVSPLAV